MTSNKKEKDDVQMATEQMILETMEELYNEEQERYYRELKAFFDMIDEGNN